MEQMKRRIPIVAFLLSLPLPGLGHVYNGHLVEGILVFVGLWLLLLVAGLSGLPFSPAGLICFIIIGNVYQIFVAMHATIEASRLKTAHLKWYNKWYVYVCVSILVGLTLEPAARFMWIDLVGGRAFKTPASSMAPTLQKGDHFLVKLARYNDRLPARGDIVIFPYPDDRSVLFVKRILGLPGERIHIKDKIVFINDQRLDDPWGVRASEVTMPNDIGPRDNYGPVSIPEGHVFVMGDNRDFSQDSRFWGFVDIKDIQGKALFIYWSDDLSRVGKQLE